MIALNKMVVQGKMILKHQKKMKKWEKVKHKKYLFELKKNKFKKWTFPQLKGVLFFFKGTEDGPLPTTKTNLIKLWIEWESKLKND